MSEQQQASLSSQVGREGDHDMETVAQIISEEPSKLRKRLDVTQVLEGMQRGVLVTLSISRPRFSVAVAGKRKGSSEMSGLEKLGLVLSSEGQRVLSDYFSLGRHSLLPRQWQEDLNTAEVSARRCLADFSLKTHWGAFLPSAQYLRWKEVNARYEEQFWALRDRILEEYEEMRATVEADYRRLAEDTWAHTTFGRVALRAHSGEVTQDMLGDLGSKLSEQEAHEEYLRRYMSVIEAAIPTRQQLEDAFVYETELGYIPLPAQVARAQSVAESQTREQLLQEATMRAEREVIEAKQRAEIEAIEAECHTTQALLSMRARNELAQVAMERDVIEKAKAQKEQLVAEFYEDIVQYVNEKIAQTCARATESLEKNDGILRGPVSDSLRDLVTWLSNLNIVEDQQIEDQIQALRDVLPTQEDRETARRGIARIDTSRIKTVVHEMEEVAEQTLLELELSQAPRRRRNLALDEETLLAADEPRRSARRKGSALPMDVSRRKRNEAKKAGSAQERTVSQ